MKRISNYVLYDRAITYEFIVLPNNTRLKNVVTKRYFNDEDGINRYLLNQINAARYKISRIVPPLSATPDTKYTIYLHVRNPTRNLALGID